MESFDHKHIEEKWQEKWEKDNLYTTLGQVDEKENFYALIEFPYPSGNLHIGHWYAFAVPDIFVRFKRMSGYNVLFPIGFDSFGLPAENAAIKRNLDPREWTNSNIEYMTGQLKSMGASFDWSRCIQSSDPSYYRWTQYIFTKMFEEGLAYQKDASVNWCPSCNTVLANEQVVEGLCERCDTEVEQRNMKQWFLRITDYADRLLEGLDSVDWPEEIKESQRNWIGKSEGASFEFKTANNSSIEVFTTRPDTFFGVTYLVVAPEYEKLEEWKDSIQNWDEVEKYITQARKKGDLERQEQKEKTGIELKGIQATHPATGEDVPVWVADYVLATYGTGAVMAVPAHDERDWEFADTYNLPIRPVVLPHYIDDVNPPVEGKKKVRRRTIHAIVKNPKTQKVLCLEWKEHPWTTFIVGGVDEGEDIEEAARREIKEETGYTDLELVKKLGNPVCGEYFAAHKDENRVAVTTGLVFKLKSEKRVEVSEKEAAKHSIVWKDFEEISPETFTCAELEMWLERVEKVDEHDVYTNKGMLWNSEEFSGMISEEAGEKIAEEYGKKETTYRLRDWSIGRQRYWGCPIPIVYDPDGKAHAVPEKHLPWTLPDDADHTPTGEAPLASSQELKERVEDIFGKGWTPEIDTMDTFVDSSWYYLRYLDPENTDELSREENQKKWMPVDYYSGGAEHTTMHLLYARFFYKAMADLGLAYGQEPFKVRMNRGLILGPDGQKMSKSRGNVIDPDDQVSKVGSDCVRMYLAFVGPYNEVGTYPWDLDGIAGIRRFLERVWTLKGNVGEGSDEEIVRLLHQTVKKVGEDIDRLKFNTAISALMEFLNAAMKEGIGKKEYQTFVCALAPFAPHLAEEIWEHFGNESSVHLQEWPEYDVDLIQDVHVTIVVQIDGKVRDSFEADKGLADKELEKKAQAREKIQERLADATVERVIVVSDKLVNFVTKS